MFIGADQSRFTSNSVMKLNLPFRNKNTGQKGISYLGPKIWNELPPHIKICDSVNTFKHRIKEKYFDHLKKKEDDIYIYIYISITRKRLRKGKRNICCAVSSV